jgi:hypothetical protein
MSIRNRSRSTAAIVIAFALSTLICAGAAKGGVRVSKAAADTLAWFGCWRLEAAEEDEEPDLAADSQLLCVEPGEGASALQLRAIVDGEVVAEEVLVADGSRRPVSEGGCSGWKRAVLSADQRRLYLQAETICEGGNESSLSGASLITSEGHWVDISLTRVAGERELAVRHYRIVDVEPPSSRRAGDPAYTVRLPGTLPGAVSTARAAAAVPLEEEDVIEALAHVDAAVVEAMLVESKSSFRMDSRRLLRLDDAGVPGAVIDLMMAMSYPAYFAIEDASVTTRAVGYNPSWGPWSYGHAYWYGYGYKHDDSHSRPRQRGLAISRGGYTRVKATKLPSGHVVVPVGGETASSGSTGFTGSTGGVSSGPSSGSGSSASGSGYKGSSSGSKGSSSGSTRKAVRR